MAHTRDQQILEDFFLYLEWEIVEFCSTTGNLFLAGIHGDGAYSEGEEWMWKALME